MLGDGRGEVVTVAGDKLFDPDNLVKSGSEAPLPLPVRDTHSSLSSKVFALVPTISIYNCVGLLEKETEVAHALFVLHCVCFYAG